MLAQSTQEQIPKPPEGCRSCFGLVPCGKDTNQATRQPQLPPNPSLLFHPAQCPSQGGVTNKNNQKKDDQTHFALSLHCSISRAQQPLHPNLDGHQASPHHILRLCFPRQPAQTNDFFHMGKSQPSNPHTRIFKKSGAIDLSSLHGTKTLSQTSFNFLLFHPNRMKWHPTAGKNRQSSAPFGHSTQVKESPPTTWVSS